MDSVEERKAKLLEIFDKLSRELDYELYLDEKERWSVHFSKPDNQHILQTPKMSEFKDFLINYYKALYIPNSQPTIDEMNQHLMGLSMEDKDVFDEIGNKLYDYKDIEYDDYGLPNLPPLAQGINKKTKKSKKSKKNKKTKKSKKTKKPKKPKKSKKSKKTKYK